MAKDCLQMDFEDFNKSGFRAIQTPDLNGQSITTQHKNMKSAANLPSRWNRIDECLGPGSGVYGQSINQTYHT